MTFPRCTFSKLIGLFINKHWNQEYSEQPKNPASPSLVESLIDITCGVIPGNTSATFSPKILSWGCFPSRVAQDATWEAQGICHKLLKILHCLGDFEQSVEYENIRKAFQKQNQKGSWKTKGTKHSRKVEYVVFYQFKK